MKTVETLTVITLGYDSSFVIDPKDVSTLLAIFAKSQRVANRWDGSNSVWSERDNGDRITIVQADGPVISKAELEARVAARKAADEAAEREAEAA